MSKSQPSSHLHLQNTETVPLAYPRSLSHLDPRWIAVIIWAGMALSLALCYLGGGWAALLGGLVVFGGLATLRPDLAVLFVPLTAPLFLTLLTLPASGQQIALPPHELALLVTAAVALPKVLAGYIRHQKASRAGTNTSQISHSLTRSFAHHQESKAPRWARKRSLPLASWCLGGYSNGIGARTTCGMRQFYRVVARHAPETLLLIAGVAGLCMAGPEPEARADALRAFRWFVAEPLILLALIRSHALWRTAEPGEGATLQAQRLLHTFVIGGTAVALIGLLQFAGYLLHAQMEPPSFAAGAGVLGGMRRVTSVYGNPNNMALYLGRVWPLAVVLAAARFRTENRELRTAQFGSWFLVLGSLMCLAGIVVSLSRGAWMGAGAALMVLILPAARRRFRGWLLPGALVAGAIVVMIGALIFALRGGPLGGSADVRILFWQESLKLLERRPLGVGLDQFFYYHHPAYGRSQIDSSLANTQERYARQPHNLVFEIWLNLGPLGVIAFGWLLMRCLRHARATLRSPPSANAALLMRGVLAALAAAVTHGLVDSFYFWPDIAIAFWLLLGASDLIGQERRQQL